jgi:hypothetical protein
MSPLIRPKGNLNGGLDLEHERGILSSLFDDKIQIIDAAEPNQTRLTR